MAAIVASTPLLNGHCLAVAFVECLTAYSVCDEGEVGEGGGSGRRGPSALYDELVQLLIDGLPQDKDLDEDIRSTVMEESMAVRQKAVQALHRNNQLRLLSKNGDSSILLLYKVYRAKLQVRPHLAFHKLHI
jgi:hypothetical protein